MKKDKDIPASGNKELDEGATTVESVETPDSGADHSEAATEPDSPELSPLEQKLKEAFATHPVADRFFSTSDEVLHFSNYDAVNHQQSKGEDANAIECHERPE
jgi:hypothetical protein